MTSRGSFLLRWTICAVALFALHFWSAKLSAQVSPATKPAAQIRTWVAQLGNADSSLREKARDQLMLLSVDDLPTIRRIVEELGPEMKPAQKAYIQDIVFQLFLSGLEYEPDTVPGDEVLGLLPKIVLDPQTGQPIPGARPKPREMPFLGISWPMLGTDFTAETESGVVVARRIRGFAAYRTLRDGDIIKQIVEAPDATVTNSNNFSSVIGTFNVGQTVHFKILRNGQPMEVPVTLVARPRDVSNMNIDAWLQVREDRAREYWTQNFQPLFKDDPATAATQP
jgi:hypothetical protein